MESLFADVNVLSPKARISGKRVITFDPIVGSPSNFYSSFQRPFSLENIWNPYSLKRRSSRARPE
jgi:hypothetical protein